MMTAASRPIDRLVPMIVLTAILALGLTAVGCNDEKKLTPPPPVSEYLAQSSAANVLANLQRAYAEKSFDEYRKLFTTDFTFVFSPSDVVNPDNPTPIQWGLSDELESAQHMFTDSLVVRVELTSYSLGVPEPADSIYYGRGTWKLRVDEVRLLVETRREDTETLIYIVEGTTERFYFRSNPLRLAADGKPSWFIFRWEDQPVGGGKTESKSWGSVKALYL